MENWVDVRAGARLDWLPQETILYDGGTLRRTLIVNLAQDAAFLAPRCAMLSSRSRRMRAHTIMVTIMADGRAATGTGTATDLVRLMTWLSAGFPVGAYSYSHSYSHGLERAVHDGLASSADELADWLSDLIEHGSGWNDAVLLGEAWNASRAGDMDRLEDVAELGAAMATTSERHLEVMQQGAAFLAAVGRWPGDAVRHLGAQAPYPVAVGAAAAGTGIGLESVASAYLLNFTSNLVSAALRLIPLGQTEGVNVIALLEPVVLSVAGRAARATLDDLGSASVLSEIMSMKHEVQYSRLFRS